MPRQRISSADHDANSIEGYDATLDDVLAALDGEPTLDADQETQLASMIGRGPRG